MVDVGVVGIDSQRLAEDLLAFLFAVLHSEKVSQD